MPSPERATCAGCGLLCDDITAVVSDDGALECLERTCPLGDAWFSERVNAAVPPARVDGREASVDEALDAAAGILAGARSPLVYGLGGVSCEAQRAAVALAEAIGAVVDPAGPLLDGASGLAFQARGASTATLGEVRDRAAAVVVWRADPATTNPRLFERLRLPDPARPLIVVDAERTETAALADTFLTLAPERDLEALSTLRAGVRGRTIGRADDLAPFDDLAARLVAFGHVAVLQRVRGLAEALALHALVRDLAGVTHAVSMTLRREGNAAGAEDVLAWQTGYPSAVSFAGGAPRANPGEWSAAAVLGRPGAGGALGAGSDPLPPLPRAAAERLRAIPVVPLDAGPTAPPDGAGVAFTPAPAGVHRAGVGHRL